MVMASDRYQPWDIEAENLKETCDDLATNLLERKRLLSRGLNTSDIDRQISTALSNIKTGITSLESELSAAESKCAVPTSELKKWEQTILALSKQYDRLEFLAKTDDRSTDTRAQLLSARQPHSSATPSSTILSSPLTVDEGLPLGSLNNHEVLQLQERVIQEQDSHLDELAETIGRQRQIGLLISDELDLHADLLEEHLTFDVHETTIKIIHQEGCMHRALRKENVTADCILARLQGNVCEWGHLLQ
ncbi:hypothetical protein SeLEV6574_g03156 [Synchytrium endobioticum]|uniref:t-SNARE coiled-coil homology domain-containing protein n=1 Tax=Synchytrium endobioticum TaxID=286115 RepID=A0A507D5N4_9FUNG|nr:hypothetical protein SeLEV6574_g03156 [Synchytrium endobioticum]